MLVQGAGQRGSEDRGMSTGPILTTPEQHDLSDPTVERNPKRLQEWLNELPLMNVGESLRQLINALEPLNEQRMPPLERLALLNLYREPVAKLFASSTPADLRRLPISKAERQQAVDNLERLCLGLAGGFKLVVKGLYAQSEEQRGAFGRALEGALTQLARSLVHSYRCYRPVPPFVFLELHQLYRLARQQGLALATEGEPKASLAARYQAIMLLALTDPFHLSEGSVERLYRVLRQVSHLARTIPGHSWEGSPEGLYALDLRSDSPPALCVRLTSPAEADDPYLLDGRSAVQALHQALAQRPAQRRGQTVEAQLLRSLVPEVPGSDQRREGRHSDGRWLELLVGLDAMHDYLAQRTGTAPTRRMGSSLELAGGGEVHAMRVLDASAKGMRLHWGGAGLGELQVGDLLGVLSDTAEVLPRLQLATIRWVRCERDGSAALGVELVDGRPSAVNCRQADEEQGDVVRCLFLPSAADTASAGLIAPSGLYAPQRRLLLYVGRREVSVRMGQLVQETELWERFEFAADAPM